VRNPCMPYIYPKDAEKEHENDEKRLKRQK